MATHTDIRNYYRTLGVPHTASSDELKQAYRALAKERHPDRHQGDPAATANFQALNEAYEVLSNPEKRATYDAACAADPSTEVPGQEITAVKCSACGVVSAQPRYVIFWYVVSFIFATSRRTIQGIFCPACAQKKALRASTTTWLFGWWGVPWGPIFSVLYLWRNILNGVQPADANAQILGHQSIFFWSQNKPGLAAAVLAQAQKLKLSPAALQRLSEIKKHIPEVATGLVDRWKLYRRWIFWVQLAPFVLILLALTWSFRNEVLDSLSKMEVAHVTAGKAAILETASPYAANMETIRPFVNFQVLHGRGENGYDRVMADNGVVGYIPEGLVTYGDGSADLRQRCLPDGPEVIENGAVLHQNATGPHSITAKNGYSLDAVVRLSDDGGNTVLSFYVTAGEEATVNTVPNGTFVVGFATGNTFSRSCGFFLANMTTKKFLDTTTFEERIEGDQKITSGLTVTLNPVLGGTAPTTDTDPANFDSN